MKRKNITSGSPWEKKVGYSRGVIAGDIIEISGTTAVDQNGNVIGRNDPYAQTVYILDKIRIILEENGSRLEDVIRTRMYVTDISHWETIGDAHGKFFKYIKPASTMIEVKGLIDSLLLVEIEVTASIGSGNNKES